MIVAIGIADGVGYLGALICDTAFESASNRGKISVSQAQSR